MNMCSTVSTLLLTKRSQRFFGIACRSISTIRGGLAAQRLLAGLLLLQLALAGPAIAGTVITANLPANTAIVNISGTQDGAASYNGDQSLWYHPFNTVGTLLEYTVQAGTYGFRVVNPADAAQLFPALTTLQTNQIFTAWTYNSPWVEDYLVFDSAAATNFSLPQIFDGDPEWPPYSNPAAAYNATITNGTYDQIRVGPLGRDSTNIVNSYTFTNTETLIFVVPDYYLGDNSGGVSVLIAPAAPVTQPLLTVSESQGLVALAWTTKAVGFSLQSCTDLMVPGWINVTNTPVIQNTNYVVTVPADLSYRFFRLIHY